MMRDWSNLLSKVQKMSYEEIVAKGREIVDDVLESVAKYSDSDAAPIMLVGLAAYTASVDDDLSDIEFQLMNDVVGIREKDFRGFVKIVKGDKKIVKELREIALCMTSDEMDNFAFMLAMIFAVDGNISTEEIEFLKELCG
ncbi:MAG: hypothetical protein E7544_04310 [Ruminococcaceae bacterium]|nr:hypothetical protein [Oscillospiraceae bacterium]